MDRLQPHDLLWGLAPDQLPVEAPAWARQVLAAGQPVVVRRACCPAGQVAVGVRGATRAERFAACMPVAAVQQRLAPEQLRLRAPGELPALRALAQVTPLMDALGLPWGPTGGVGYQLATGRDVLHGSSDLDLLLRTAEPLPRAWARELLVLFEDLPCRVDLQLQTPQGGVALREWGGSARRVLLKCDAGARLVDNPWQPLEDSA